MKTILVGTDGSPAGDAAVARALALAEQHGAAVHVVQVLPIDAAADQTEAALALLRALVRRSAGSDKEPETQVDVITGDPPAALANRAAAIGADLIVVGGSSRRGWSQALFGSTAEALLRESATPLLIAHAGSGVTHPYRRAIAAIASDDSLRLSIDLACLIGVQSMCAVRAFELPFEAHVIGGQVTATIRAEESRAFGERVARISGDVAAPVDVDSVAIEADVVSALGQASVAASGDLLILTTHARSGLRWLVRGSVADSLLEQLPNDMLIGRLHRR